MTQKQWQKFLETGEARHETLMYRPLPDPRESKGQKYLAEWWNGTTSQCKLRDAGLLCRTAEEADQLAGVMLAAARTWREKR